MKKNIDYKTPISAFKAALGQDYNIFEFFSAKYDRINALGLVKTGTLPYLN